MVSSGIKKLIFRYCHDQANTPECSFDGGDCCNPVTLINSCQDCECRQADKSLTIVHRSADCPKPWQQYLNNGHCEDIVSHYLNLSWKRGKKIPKIF